MNKIFWSLSSSVLFALATQSQALTVTVQNGTNTWSCGSMTTLTQNTSTLTINVSGDCVADNSSGGGGNTGGGGDSGGGNTGGGDSGSGGGNTGGGDSGSGGGNAGGGDSGGNTGGGTQCVTSGNIICKGVAKGMPNIELTDTWINPGEIHVYSFVYRDSWGRGKIGPVFRGLREFKISTTPGDVTPTNDGCYKAQRQTLQKLYYEPASNAQKRYACDLVDGQTYYVNIKTRLHERDLYRLLGNQGF